MVKLSRLNLPGSGKWWSGGAHAGRKNGTLDLPILPGFCGIGLPLGLVVCMYIRGRGWGVGIPQSNNPMGGPPDIARSTRAAVFCSALSCCSAYPIQRGFQGIDLQEPMRRH